MTSRTFTTEESATISVLENVLGTPATHGCPICGGTDINDFNGVDLGADIAACGDCGHVNKSAAFVLLQSLQVSA